MSPTDTERQAADSDTAALRRELQRLIDNYSIEVATVLAPRSPETFDSRSYRHGFNAGARAALARAVNDLKEALA